jgi:hypothetical protein
MNRLTGLAIAAAVLSASTALAATPSAPGMARNLDVMWRCDVAAGPALRNCAVLAPSHFDPQKTKFLARFAEWIPACDLRGATVGGKYNVRYGLADVPELWERIGNGDWLPDWVKPLTDADLYVPTGVTRGGQAVVQCRVQLSGVPTDCEAVREDPPGMAFGEAAIKSIGNACFFPQIVDGSPVDTGKIVVPIAFGAR